MSLKDPSLLPLIPTVRETRTFTDPQAPGEEWEFVFEARVGGATFLAVRERAGQFIQQFIHDGIPVQYGDSTIPISEGLCYEIATIDVMNRTPADGIPWGFRHWAIFAERCQSAFFDVSRFAEELIQKATPRNENNEIQLKNVSMASEGDLSALPPTTDTSTPIS